jgi:hypothetical protein
MRRRLTLISLFVWLTFFLLGHQLILVRGQKQTACDALKLSDQEVKEIVEKERAKRTDLPLPFEKFNWIVQKDGCYYVYTEYGLPAAPEHNHIFRLNRYGVIVDARPGKINCPEKTLAKSELAATVAKERASRQALPQTFAQYETRVERLRCMYLYFEYALPREKGDYQVYTIDPYGELMDVYRSKPKQ